MRVLTFNSHQPYVHLLASVLPWTFGVVTPRLPSGKTQSWDEKIRPLPANVRLFDSVDGALRMGPWNWILAHNIQDLLDCRMLYLPKAFLVHGTLSGRILQDRSNIDKTSYLGNVRTLLRANRCEVVYISKLKQEDWGLGGRIIRPAVDPEQYGGYRGDFRGLLQVCNHLRERGRMLGWEAHEAICSGLPSLVLGVNRGLEGSRVAESWEDLKEQYRTYRVYVHTAIYPYEDGYNLAMLEAMATGMPIASIQSPTSPIVDGVEGIVAPTPAELRNRLMALLDNPEEARVMGAAARARLETEFPLGRFVSSWTSLAADLT